MTVADDLDVLGPVEFAVVEFPGGEIGGDGFARLLQLADSGVIRVLDLEFVTRAADGSVIPVEVSDVTVGPGVDLTPFDGASSGLVDATDLAALGDSIAVGSVAAVLVYEEQVLIPVVAAWHSAGGRSLAQRRWSAGSGRASGTGRTRRGTGRHRRRHRRRHARRHRRRHGKGELMGLFKTAAKVAVASSVHGRIQRRQQQRWAAQDAAAARATPPAPPPPAVAPQAAPPPPASGVDMATKLAQLQQLGELKTAGVLTDAEFESQKAAILAQ